ncbi:Syntaxin-22 [Platanthera zijinensis]|uniref:Syntaxin-22 n=1 Tax=Platanthera zijinensis TaxID=2320716 RepID=A0AAP0C1Y7_9ASPA
MGFQDLESGRQPLGRSNFVNSKQDPTQAVAAGVFQINTAVSTFQRLVNTLGTPKDTPELRQKLLHLVRRFQARVWSERRRTARKQMLSGDICSVCSRSKGKSPLALRFDPCLPPPVRDSRFHPPAAPATAAPNEAWSPRGLFDKFSQTVSAVEFTRSSADFSLFTRHRPTCTLILLVYVDDILNTGDDLTGIHMIKQQLLTVFQIKDLENLRYFLGLEVAQRPDKLALSQRKYCFDLLHDAGYSRCKPVDGPMDINHKLCAHASDSDFLLTNLEYYRRLVRKLIYLTVTRPDILFVVGVVSRFMHESCISHLQAVERILRYLKTAPEDLYTSLLCLPYL